MRMMLNITIPHEPFNSAVRDGTAGQKMQRILEETKPEAVYFSEKDGHRHAVLVVNVEAPSHIPAFAEPWFILFNADVEFRVVMKQEDLAKSDLDGLGKKWSR